MNRCLRNLAVAGLLAALASVASAQTGEAVEKSARFRVLIDAGGKLKTALPLDATLGDALNRAIIGAARELAFEPATRDGRPAEFESQLFLTARLVPLAEGGAKVVLTSASLSPQALEMRPMVFPRGLDRRKDSGFVAARVAVGADGKVDAARSEVLQVVTSRGSEKAAAEFGEAVLTALRAWRYEPDRVGGQPIATDTLMTSRFCIEDCSVPAEPSLAAERAALPRVATPGVTRARVPQSLRAARSSSAFGKPLYLRLAVDATGAVTGVKPLAESDAALLEPLRARLMAMRFSPTTVGGRAVSSEFPASVPVRLVEGVAQPQLERLGFDIPLLKEPMPHMPSGRNMRSGEVRARLRVVTHPDGRANLGASRVESLEVLPNSSAALRRSVQQQFEASIARTRVEPVLVDGKGIVLEFQRSRVFTFCSAPGSCEPKPAVQPPPDPPVKLPAGIELARPKP